MQLGYPLVITPEKSREILCQVLFVGLCQGADNAKIKRDVTPKCGRLDTDLDIAGMHVCMEKSIPKNLGKENRDTIARQFGNIHASRTQPINLVDRNTLHALHDHDVGHAIVPEHLGNQNQVKIGHVAPQLCRTGGLTHQVQLIVQVLVKLGHHFARLEPFAVIGQTVDPASHHSHQVQVFVDGRQHARTQHFDGNFTMLSAAVLEYGKVHLGDRGAGDWLALKRHKNVVHLFLESFLDDGNGHLARKRRHPILQHRQFIGDVDRQQVASRRQHLAELDKYRTQTLQRLTDTLSTGCRQVASRRQQTCNLLEKRAFQVSEYQLIKTMAQQHPNDENAPKKARHRGVWPGTKVAALATN
ncbi:hypothetical protein GALL_491170 [mine drainage metagenome]|uniref:Uncharacterized protein n=1 Tax=mine drainage metagenome TaxID=410659 RepID=A0A1J5PVG3_9ZZZZ